MDMLTRPQGISLPLAPALAGSIGFGIAIVVGTLPAPLFEGLVMGSGLPALISAAEPPLGLTARALVTVSLALLIAAVVQVPLSYAYGRRRLRVRTPRPRIHKVRLDGLVPQLAEKQAKPRPIAAHEELGAPFLSVSADAPSRKPAPAAQPERVTDMVELVGGVYIPDRRRRPRGPRARDPIFDAEPTVPNLLKRLEAAIASEQLGPLGRRPLDPGFCEAVERLNGLRRAG
ncbi:hypothetical protein D1610_04870 [Sphingomonas gilva]|uniref:Uncharacterized protein n=1 Tax=Sphingomonas gilva TaxID=2305907 RepID=A0A396S398_9SPHN|nr:hypothetical protein [Sphingomonas gilva]RHW17855.1 hypothetical protein D1610_04870 [Sphingomonas gilva]